MARVICIMGESGAGKTTSLRNLDPKTTFIIDADRKGLSWRGWKKQYNNANKNYLQTSNVSTIEKCMERIDTQDLQNIKVMVIDTLNAIMIDDEMARMKEKNFDKWQDLATCIWRIVSKFHLMRDDLTVVCIAHTQTDRDDAGFYFTHIKTSGKKLDKIVLESKFTTVLLAKALDGNYVFETYANHSTAKSPMGCFEKEIPNDIKFVIEELIKYENDEE